MASRLRRCCRQRCKLPVAYRVDFVGVIGQVDVCVAHAADLCDAELGGLIDLGVLAAAA